MSPAHSVFVLGVDDKPLTPTTPASRVGRLCGEYKGGYRYYDQDGKRRKAKRLSWISNQFVIRKPLPGT